ncbi:hypothetical protein [Micromonospora sp. NPDC047740]|uniref:hypothetical protein n=1 Tax=Micromonospora sp. NPDC047740 TaxID=3364254 RepID=UPI003720DB0D
MTERNHHNAPAPVGDVVPGDPPVPITVWPIPAPQPGETMSTALGMRLVYNLTHPSDLIIDLTDGPQLAGAILAAHRHSHLQAARSMSWGSDAAMLIVTGWPLARDVGVPVEFFARGRARLLPGGCLVVLLVHGDPILPVDVVIAAKQAGLSYLQHIVAADQPPTRGQRTQLDIHTDVLVFARPTAGGDGDA